LNRPARVLLCSDGLTNMVPEEGIYRILQSEADTERACRQLVALANEQGGTDNITVIVARFEASTKIDSVA
jgi:PPM family protein phosphatase